MLGPQSQLGELVGGGGGGGGVDERQMEILDGKIARVGLELGDLRP